MLAVLAGIALIIVGVVLWLGNLTVAHGLALFTGITGILLLAYWAYPAGWTRRGP
jgi:hypothetical protein